MEFVWERQIGEFTLIANRKVIEVDIEGKICQFTLTSCFWRDCPEFRDSGQSIIRDWLKKYKTLDWPKGKPPQIKLIPLGNTFFRLLP